MYLLKLNKYCVFDVEVEPFHNEIEKHEAVEKLTRRLQDGDVLLVIGDDERGI